MPPCSTPERNSWEGDRQFPTRWNLMPTFQVRSKPLNDLGGHQQTWVFLQDAHDQWCRKPFRDLWKITPVIRLWSRLSRMLSVKWPRAVTVDNFGRKLNWIWVSSLDFDKEPYSCPCKAPSRILLMVGRTVLGPHTAVLTVSATTCL